MRCLPRRFLALLHPLERWLLHAPEHDGRLRIEVDGNGFAGELSADAAGIVATLFALNQLCAELAGTADADALIDRYHHLAAFASEHAEAAAIYRAID